MADYFHAIKRHPNPNDTRTFFKVRTAHVYANLPLLTIREWNILPGTFLSSLSRFQQVNHQRPGHHQSGGGDAVGGQQEALICFPRTHQRPAGK